MNQKGFAPIILILGIVLILGITGGAYFLSVQNDTGMIPTPIIAPKACTQEAKICPDGSTVGRSGPNCEFSPCPLFKEKEGITPTNGVQHQISVTPTGSSLDVKTLTYNLPSGWDIITEQNNIFQIGYDPNLYKASLSTSGIDLNSKSCCSSFFINIIDYDGSSNPQFVLKNLGAVKTAKTYERNYIINGKIALIIFNLDISGSSTGGMIDINGKKAIVISSQAGDQRLVDQILSTFKFIK